MHLNDAFTLGAVLGLNTFPIFEENFLISDLFMPRPVVLGDIKVCLKPRILTESEANGALDRLYECKGGNCYEC